MIIEGGPFILLGIYEINTYCKAEKVAAHCKIQWKDDKEKDFLQMERMAYFSIFFFFFIIIREHCLGRFYVGAPVSIFSKYSRSYSSEYLGLHLPRFCVPPCWLPERFKRFDGFLTISSELEERIFCFQWWLLLLRKVIATFQLLQTFRDELYGLSILSTLMHSNHSKSKRSLRNAMVTAKTHDSRTLPIGLNSVESLLAFARRQAINVKWKKAKICFPFYREHHAQMVDTMPARYSR